MSSQDVGKQDQLYVVRFVDLPTNALSVEQHRTPQDLRKVFDVAVGLGF